jgi:hypothetical protein
MGWRLCAVLLCTVLIYWFKYVDCSFVAMPAGSLLEGPQVSSEVPDRGTMVLQVGAEAMAWKRAEAPLKKRMCLSAGSAVNCDRCNCWSFWLVFGRSAVRTSAGAGTTLTIVLCISAWSLQVNARTLCWTTISSTSFVVHRSPLSDHRYCVNCVTHGVVK